MAHNIAIDCGLRVRTTSACASVLYSYHYRYYYKRICDMRVTGNHYYFIYHLYQRTYIIIYYTGAYIYINYYIEMASLSLLYLAYMHLYSHTGCGNQVLEMCCTFFIAAGLLQMSCDRDVCVVHILT